MPRDFTKGQAQTKTRKSSSTVASEEQQKKKSKRSAFARKSEHNDGGNPIHRRLKYHEKKLLRKHDFLQYPQDLWHEPFCITKYHLEDREDYRRYLRLVSMIRALMSQLRYLPADSKVRIEITQQLLDRLYDMQLIQERRGLAEVDKVGVEAFCKRRLPSILVSLSMAPNCKLASDYIHHGHVRVGTQQMRDPAFLVPRAFSDHVSWMAGSKIKSHIDEFNAEKEDL